MSKLWNLSKPFGFLSLPLPSELAGMMALNTCIVLSISTALVLSLLCHVRVPSVLWMWTNVRSMLEQLRVARMEPHVLTLLDLTRNMLPDPCHHLLFWIAFIMMFFSYSFLLFSSSCNCLPEWYGPHCTSRYDDCAGGSQDLCVHGLCIDSDRVTPNEVIICESLLFTHILIYIKFLNAK